MCRGVPGSGSRVRCCAYPFGLAAVPQDLHQREDERPLELVGIGRVQHQGELVEVDAAREQEAVVHRPDVEHRPREVGRHRRQRAAGDPALAVAVVEEPAGVDERLAVPPEGRVGRQAARVHERPPEEQEVQEALLEAVGQRREPREVPEHRDGVGDVLLGHPDPVARADQDVVVVAELLDVVGPDLARVPEQPMAVERRARRGARRGRARDVADEPRLGRVAGQPHGQPVRPEAEARARGAPGLVEVARDGHVALDAAGHVRLLGDGVVGDLVDRVRGGAAPDAEVGEVAVPAARRTRGRGSRASAGSASGRWPR